MTAFPRIVPLTVAAALLMENIDSGVIATSLPQIARDLGEDPVTLKLALTSYLLSLAVFIPVSGWVADRFGPRNVFRLAIVVFTLASIWCGFSYSLEHLVTARSLQGLGGAMMIPVGRAILLRAVPREQIVNAMVYLTVPALVGPLIGPPLGGFITEYFDWRWIFWVNVPVGAIGIGLATAFIPDVQQATRVPLDALGFLLSGGGLSATIFGLTGFSGRLLPAGVAPSMVLFGLVLLVLYVLHARRRAHPILDLSLFKIETYRASVVGGSLFRIGAGAIPFLMPLLLQLVFGFDAFASGSITFVAAIGAMSMKLAAQPILRQFGFRRVLLWNSFIAAGFIVAYALFSRQTPVWLIMVTILLGGFFRSLQFTSLNAIAYSDVPETRISQAATLSSAAQQTAVAAGVALAAFSLDAARAMRGDGSLVQQDFAMAFAIVAVLTMASAYVPWRLPPDAGQVVSGHRGKFPTA
jgi:EmrB/QacA subfamily drug resistance transporter